MTPEQALDNARAAVAEAQKNIDLLRGIEPYFIDLSLRENPVGSRVGQTLQDKLDIFPRIREFGFKNILLGTLDYSYPQWLEVDDDFMMYMRDNKMDMTGGYAFTDIGLVQPDGSFQPSASMLKLKDYCVPNTLHEIYLSKEGMDGQYTLDELRRSLPVSIQWLMDNINGGDGRTSGVAPRIMINIVDGCDAFAEDLETTCSVLAEIAQQPVEGLSMEDDRGTYMPFQVGAFVKAARGFLPPPLKLLVHMHAGGGFENSSVIEALLNGADGAWGALPKRAAIIGHASLGELIANLVRVGNKHMSVYQLNELLPLATNWQVLDELEEVPDDLPILGKNAYRLPLTFFRQIPDRPMDLIPEAIGGTYQYRICPVVSDTKVIAGRLAEVTGEPAGSFPQDTLEKMIMLMRQDLRAGLRIVYDEPENLEQLFIRAAST